MFRASTLLRVQLGLWLCACGGAASATTAPTPVPDLPGPSAPQPTAAGSSPSPAAATDPVAAAPVVTTAPVTATPADPAAAAAAAGGSAIAPVVATPVAMTAPAAVGGATAAADDPNSVMVKMDDFSVPPGTEVFMCQDFPNPFGGADVAVGRSESTMTTGSHHLHVYYGMDTPASLAAAPCENPNEFRPMIHLATVAHQVSDYGTGTAAVLKGGVGLRFMAHYVNLGTEPITGSVVLKLTKVDPSTITRWVGQLHFNRIQMSLAPGSTQDVTTSCTIPSTFGPIGLLNAVSHMHKHATHFVATTSSGVSLLDTTDWDEAPPMDYPTPVMLNPGDAITWTCTYQNDTDQTITYGDSAIKNEMCIYIARFFSSPSGDDLECETPTATMMAKSTKNVAGM
jgi:hypothetical protein